MLKLFPHWMDGEFVNISGDFDTHRVIEFCRYLQTILKLHALLGTELVLNDVQIFDSRAVLALFGDDDAYGFLIKDKNFLELRVPAGAKKPDQVVPSTLARSPFELATSGLAKASDRSWTSSVFLGDAEPIRRLAEEILTQGPNRLDPERPSDVVRDFPHHAKELSAIRRAVHYFAILDKPVVETHPVSSNYYSVLTTLRELTSGEDLGLIETTLAFVDTHLPGVKDGTVRATRSDVFRILVRAPKHDKHKIWNNVVLAWIQATQGTIAPKGSSVGGLPQAVTPALYLNKLVDVIHPADDVRLSDSVAQVSSNIEQLSWEQIAKARADTQHTHIPLEKVRFTGVKEAIRPALIAHAGALAEILVPATGKAVPSYVYELADHLGIYFGLSHPSLGTGLKMLKQVVKAADFGLGYARTRLQRRGFADVIVETAMPNKKGE